VHLEQNQLPDALSCFDEAFLALAKDQSRGSDIKAQATICAQYKIGVTLLQVLLYKQKLECQHLCCGMAQLCSLFHLGLGGQTF